MGCADAIPGVSGGTIALITGIYERLVHGISKIKFQFIKPLLTGDFTKFKESLLQEIDFKFFIPLFLGIAIALISLSKVISYLMEAYPAYTFGFFLGLILASSYVLYTNILKVNFKIVILSIIGFILSFIFVGLNPIATNHSLIVLFFSGLIAICAMILPGISGAFLLLLLGQYEYMLNALHNFSIVEIIVFCLGALIGILSFSKLLDYLLSKYKELTMGFLIGVMVGTLRLPFFNIVESLSTTPSFILPSYIYVVLIGLIGFILIIFMEKKLNYADI